MKTNTRTLIVLGAMIAASLAVLAPAATAAPESPSYGTVESPVGRPVEITVSSGTQAAPATYNGTLVAILPAWVIIKNGSSETWLPTDKVLGIKVDR